VTAENTKKTKEQLFSYIEQNWRQESLSHLRWQLEHDFENLFNRKNMQGHMTASGLVVDRQGRFMLINHPYLKSWLVPGGHSEGKEIALIETAKIEVLEETGYIVEPVVEAVLDVDTHFIPENPLKQEGAHYHHDCIFLFSIKDQDFTNRELEEKDIKWFKLGKTSPEIFEEFKYNKRLIRVLNKLALHHKLNPQIKKLW